MSVSVHDYIILDYFLDSWHDDCSIIRQINNGGQKTMNRKIDIYLRTLKGSYVYECSTTWSKTCKAAKESFLRKYNYLDKDQVKCCFSKS